MFAKRIIVAVWKRNRRSGVKDVDEYWSSNRTRKGESMSDVERTVHGAPAKSRLSARVSDCEV